MSSLPGFKTGITVEVRQPGGKLPLDQMSFRMCNREEAGDGRANVTTSEERVLLSV